MPSKYTYAQWLKLYTFGRQLADNQSTRIANRGWQLAQEAGIYAHMTNMISNAIIAAENGHPWQEVTDLAKLKEANYLLNVKQWEPYAILRQWDARVR